MIDEYENLAIAIVKQAARDYVHGSEMSRSSIREFFHSRWFGALTKADPEAILEKLDEEVRIHDSKRIPVPSETA